MRARANGLESLEGRVVVIEAKVPIVLVPIEQFHTGIGAEEQADLALPAAPLLENVLDECAEWRDARIDSYHQHVGSSVIRHGEGTVVRTGHLSGIAGHHIAEVVGCLTGVTLAADLVDVEAAPDTEREPAGAPVLPASRAGDRIQSHMLPVPEFMRSRSENSQALTLHELELMTRRQLENEATHLGLGLGDRKSTRLNSSH